MLILSFSPVVPELVSVLFTRELYPNSAALGGKGTMCRKLWRAWRGSRNIAAPIVVCNEQHRSWSGAIAASESRCDRGHLGAVDAITAPAVALAALAALIAKQAGDDPYLLVLPADHVIKDVKAFQTAVGVG